MRFACTERPITLSPRDRYTILNTLCETGARPRVRLRDFEDDYIFPVKLVAPVTCNGKQIKNSWYCFLDVPCPDPDQGPIQPRYWNLEDIELVGYET